MAALSLDLRGVFKIADDFLWIVVDAVGREERSEVAGNVGRRAAQHGLLGVALAFEILRGGIDGEEDGAATEDKLIDGELEFRREVLRVDDGERVESGGELGGVGLDADNLKRFFPLGGDELAGLGLLAHHHHHLSFLRTGALKWKAREEAEFLFVDLLNAINELGEIVLEELLTLGVERGEGFLLVGLGRDEAKLDLFAGGWNELGLDSGGGGALFFGSVGTGIDDVERDFSAGGAGVLAQHFLDAGRVVFVRDGQAGGGFGEIEIERDRLVDFTEERLGAGGKRINAFGGGIEARGEIGREVVDENEADEKEDDGEGFAAEFHGGRGRRFSVRGRRR